MAVNRYAEDYQIKTSQDEKGRLRQELEYTGAAYRFSAGAETARAASRRCLVFVGLSWLGLSAVLIPESSAMRRLACALPTSFALLPLWRLSTAVFTALRSKEPLERREADRLNNRFPAASALLALLSCVAFLFSLLSQVTSGEPLSAGDLSFLIGAFVCSAAALLAFRERENLRALEIRSTEDMSETPFPGE